MAAAFIHYTSAEVGPQHSSAEHAAVAGEFVPKPTINSEISQELQRLLEEKYVQELTEFIKSSNAVLTSLLCPPIGLRDVDIPEAYVSGSLNDLDAVVEPSNMLLVESKGGALSTQQTDSGKNINIASNRQFSW